MMSMTSKKYLNCEVRPLSDRQLRWAEAQRSLHSFWMRLIYVSFVFCMATTTFSNRGFMCFWAFISSFIQYSSSILRTLINQRFRLPFVHWETQAELNLSLSFLVKQWVSLVWPSTLNFWPVYLWNISINSLRALVQLFKDSNETS